MSMLVLKIGLEKTEHTQWRKTKNTREKARIFFTLFSSLAIRLVFRNSLTIENQSILCSEMANSQLGYQVTFTLDQISPETFIRIQSSRLHLSNKSRTCIKCSDCLRIRINTNPEKNLDTLNPGQLRLWRNLSCFCE